jgi:UDP-N-acetylglucosamine:LPS N-acetylglucosamine transferase
MHPNLHSTLSKYNKIVLVGGRTGGHIQPIVSLVRSLQHSNTQAIQHSQFSWIGWKNSGEEKTATSENIEFHPIPTLKLATTKSWKVLLYPLYLIVWFWRARSILKYLIDWWKRWTSGGLGRGTVWVRWKQANCWIETSFSLPNSFGTFSTKSTEDPVSENDKNHKVCLFSKWWPGSMAIGLAAWSLYIPLYIHESDTIPGRSNRILGRFANKVFLWFETAKKYFDPKKCEVVGQILDPIFSRHCGSVKQSKKIEIQKPLDRFVPREDRIQWKTDKKHILVICGSQWSRAIFEEILANLGEILARAELIIILGKLNIDMRKDFEKVISTLNFPLSNLTMVDWISQADIAHLIQDTDLAITRGSATTLAELTSFQNPEFTIGNLQLIIIPLPYSAGNHQYYNAVEYKKMGYLLLEQKNIKNLTKIIQEYV